MSLQPNKTDAVLGAEIEKVLQQHGVHTPMAKDVELLSYEEQIDMIENHVRGIMTVLGLDLEDDSLEETPVRVAKMYAKEMFWGLRSENFPKVTAVENKMTYEGMVVEKNITMMSNCEHHLVTIDGLAHVAYIPNKKVLGLSKINRIVEYYARRPQIQERLTEQIYYALSYILNTEDIAVVIDAKHFCVRQRGVEDYNSSTSTQHFGGKFKDAAARAEFLSIVNKA